MKMQPKTLLIIGLMLSTILLSGCVNHQRTSYNNTFIYKNLTASDIDDLIKFREDAETYESGWFNLVSVCQQSNNVLYIDGYKIFNTTTDIKPVSLWVNIKRKTLGSIIGWNTTFDIKNITNTIGG